MKRAHLSHLHIKQSLRQQSLYVRMLTYFLILLFITVISFTILFFATGIFDVNQKETRQYFQTELNHITQDIEKHFNSLARNGIDLSNELSDRIETKLKEQGIDAKDLSSHPELLEPLLESQMELLINSFRNTSSSGIFLILDATVNSQKELSASSKSGVYLKCTDSNMSSSRQKNIRYLRGPATLARSYGIELLPQWMMEFDVTDDACFTTPIASTTNTHLPLSQLYHWSRNTNINNDYDSGMLLSIPLIDSHGFCFGICGYEISSMLFKLSYSPNNNKYSRVFVSLSPLIDNTLHLEQGLIAGNYYTTNALGFGALTSKKSSMLTEYALPSEFKYIGLSKDITLYPTNSSYSDQIWSCSILMPLDDLSNAKRQHNHRLILILVGMIIAGLLLTWLIARLSTRPVTTALRELQEHNTNKGIAKTKILEIDDLIEYLEEKDLLVNASLMETSTTTDNIRNDTTVTPVDTIGSNTQNSTISNLTDSTLGNSLNTLTSSFDAALANPRNTSPSPVDATVGNPNNTIANNTVTVVGQSVYGIEDFGINQDVSNNTITAVANPTGSAYGIAVAILDNSTINDNNIYITVGDLTQNITTDMIHGSNAGIRLHSNSTHSYYCNNVTVNDNKIYFNTLINKTSANCLGELMFMSCPISI